MTRTLRSSLVGLVSGLALVSLFWPSRCEAQFNGVEVNAEGVLQMRTFIDPSGQLDRQRLAEMKAALDPDLARPSKLRKVSLTRLEEAMRAGSGFTDEMRYLAGLTRIQYVFLYPETGDIVIAGPAEGFGSDPSGRVVGLTSGRSILELQDLVVALRAFPPGGDPTPVIGCSIDPRPEGLQQMQAFLASLTGITPDDAERIAAGLRDSLGTQLISVMGISDKTHFAQVLVEADYRMKLIGIGLEQPPVRITSYIQRASPSSVARNAMKRWYFVPEYESVRVCKDGGAMELIGDGVKLIGENELVTENGARVKSRKMDRASDVFVHSFTHRYAELACREPVFGQLKNLIDMTIVAAFLQQNDYYGQADWKMDLLGSEDEFPVETYVSPKQVASAVNVVWKGNTLMTPIGGGVNIQPRRALTSAHLLEDENGAVQTARKNVTLEQLEPGRWWWD